MIVPTVDPSTSAGVIRAELIAVTNCKLLDVFQNRPSEFGEYVKHDVMFCLKRGAIVQVSDRISFLLARPVEVKRDSSGAVTCVKVCGFHILPSMFSTKLDVRWIWRTHIEGPHAPPV